MEALSALAPQARQVCRARLEEMWQLGLPAEGSARAGRAQLVEDAAEHRVFVGEPTLEVDIARLLHVEMQGTFDELVDGRIARRNFTEALEGARAATTLEQRETVPTSIQKKEVSKGRCTQRLAARHRAGRRPADANPFPAKGKGVLNSGG
ncbi:hypothetical protein ACFV6B_39405 [Streptomyces microflavus]|uniref:hypothetical protein n=1 Tax=Streptomyces microflavus TaxID=1919 RepID=UPI00364A4D75